ncbi:MAG TPA: hypothetical protein VFU31_30875 [Candidatus Binatia bacterium]|nr:hypothetical protein [Candidatus Binatia bacterium]
MIAVSFSFAYFFKDIVDLLEIHPLGKTSTATHGKCRLQNLRVMASVPPYLLLSVRVSV